MAEIVVPLRAKAGYIEVERTDKSGRKVKAKDHVVPSAGIHSAKEMESVMRQVAADVGADESQIRIDTYKQGRAPHETNPRHRGFARNFERRSGPVKTTQQPYIRRLFTGIPQSADEWAQHAADFERRKEAYLNDNASDRA